MKNDFRFVWDADAEKMFNAWHDGNATDYLFCVRVGDLCFEVKGMEEDDPDYPAEYDLYVGGVDDGYGYSRIKPGYPYTYYNGGVFRENAFVVGFDEFKGIAEKEFSEFINSDDELVTKALEPLNIW